jgi:hypothetical protein
MLESMSYELPISRVFLPTTIEVDNTRQARKLPSTEALVQKALALLDQGRAAMAVIEGDRVIDVKDVYFGGP